MFQQATGGGSFGREQREDDRLKHCWAQVRILDGKQVQPGPHPLPHFVVQEGLLYCVAQRRGEEKLLLVVPRTKTENGLELAHSHPMAGHLGPANTIQQIRDRFHLQKMECRAKKLFCQACPTCQVMSPRKPPPSPLIPLPIIEVPFERIGMDLVGPLPKSARGHEHILVIVDYATRYPEAIPLWKATAKAIAQELFLLSSRVGIPVEILTDQGTPFMSWLMADLCRLLKVKQLRTTVYHPQADRLVERFNQTLKQMLRLVAAEDKRDWDLMIPYVLFGIREVPQASTGFTPFELLFGRQQGPPECGEGSLGAAAGSPAFGYRARKGDEGKDRPCHAISPGTPEQSTAVWMARAKDTNARVTRWFLALQDFHFVVRHRTGAANANANGLSRIWAAFAGLSGVTPHPPPINPLLSHVSNRTRTTLGGGGSVTSVPVSHQHRLGNGGRTPALPHYRLIGPSCSLSAGSVISPADLATGEFDLQKGCS